jgi:DNA excision repair protein ERCC-3
MARLQCSTLILTTSTTAVRQWIEELLDKTTLEAGDIAEYSGATKQIRPVTIATYQIMTTRERKDAEFRHLGLFDERNWGLIIYDEVHLLPAPVFRATAKMAARTMCSR